MRGVAIVSEAMLKIEKETLTQKSLILWLLVQGDEPLNFPLEMIRTRQLPQMFRR